MPQVFYTNVDKYGSLNVAGLLLGIEVLAVQFGGWFAMEGGGDWTKVPTTIPVIIFALVYHDVIPGKIICEICFIYHYFVPMICKSMKL